MTTEKIETSKPHQAPVQEKKRPEPKRPPSSRWQEIEERRDSPKSGPLKNDQEKDEKKTDRFLSLKAKNRTVNDWDHEPSPFELFSSHNSKSSEDEGSEDFESEVEVETEVEQEQEVAEMVVLAAAPVTQEAPVTAPVSTPVSPVASASFQNLKLLEFAEKLVKKIVAMKVEGRTEITLTLKNLKLFDGGVLKVVEVDSARGQYNIHFSELNPKAHALVTSQRAEQLLKETLEAKGFTFHIITATTETEPVRAFAAEPGGERQDSEDERERDQEEQD